MIRVDPFVYLFYALLLLTLPLSWLLAALCAAAIHELCHIGMLLILKRPILGIHIGIGGAVIETSPAQNGEALLTALAGPVGSLLLFSLYRICPKLAICAGVQGFFNLIPIYPLDGGRILRCCLDCFFPGNGETLHSRIEIVLLLAFAAMAAWAAFSLLHGPAPLAVSLALILKVILRKRPCKQGENRVQ